MSHNRQPPLISALVSSYRAERFMRGLLADLERQTLAHRLEIIIVDSNSPQNEGAIVREFQQHYDNIVYLRTPERENSHQSLNRCIQLSRGKYLTLACTDDRRRPDALERQVAILEARPDIALVYGDVAVTDRENQTWESASLIGHFRFPDFDRRLLFQVCYVGPQPLWRRSLHDHYGYFDQDLWQAGDYELWLRLALKEEFLHIPEVLGIYFLSPSSNEHADPERLLRESELARERHWPKDWGPRPPQRGGFFVPVKRLNKYYLKELLRPLKSFIYRHLPVKSNKSWEKA
ncbi:MAG: glycosyltransferase [Thermodesulfobacteriota bacterium]